MTQKKNRLGPAVEIWDFDSAPEEWRNLSRHGGDEDWIIHVLDEARAPFLFWYLRPSEEMEEEEDEYSYQGSEYIEGFGWGQYIRLDDGTYLIICAHA